MRYFAIIWLALAVSLAAMDICKSLDRIAVALEKKK